jgi:K+-transporting ATPase ATPase B chain
MSMLTATVIPALPGALRKLDPRQMWHNPVMFVVEVGAALTTLLAVAEPFLGGPASSGGSAVPPSFTAGIAVWLWLTVIFANLAESVAEGRGKAQADSLRQTRTSTTANVIASYDGESDAGGLRSETRPVSSA